MNKKLKITWKAIVAVVLVFSMLIAMSAVVSAGFVELLLGEDGIGIMAASGTSHEHTASCYKAFTAYCDGAVSCSWGAFHQVDSNGNTKPCKDEWYVLNCSQ